MPSFSREYVELYEEIYKDKDYASEVNLIDSLIRKLRPGAKNLIDYGCGTGSHAAILLSKGYEMHCIDKNPYMLEKAKRKFANAKKIHFYSSEQRDSIKPQSIDVCALLFDVLSYMTTDEELIDFLSFIKKALVKNGLFIFDFWYGPGIINLKPEKRWKKYVSGNRKVLRLTSPEHDTLNCIINVTHEVVVFENDKIVSRFTDIHRMRYFFKNEIELLLKSQGFEILRFGTWQDIDALPTVNDWSVLAVARLVE